MLTRYDDLDESKSHLPILSARPPYWYDPKSRPCDCVPNAKTIDEHVGYSDTIFWRIQCQTCGHIWCCFLEG